MPLILRAVKGSKLTISEMDGNLLWLAGNISGSGIIPVTGSGIDASNTPITSSFFVGDGSKLTNVTASFITASNVYGPSGASSVLSSSYARTASYSTTLVANVTNPNVGELRFVNSAGSSITSITDLTSSLAVNALTASIARFVTASNVFGPYGSNSVISASYALSASRAVSSSFATTSSYANSINPIISGALDLSGSLTINGILIVGGNSITNISNIGGSDTQIQFNSGSVFSGSNNFRFNYNTNTINLTGSISASNGTGTIGFFGTASWAVSSSQTLSSSYAVSASQALTASYVDFAPFRTGSFTGSFTGSLTGSFTGLVSASNMIGFSQYFPKWSGTYPNNSYGLDNSSIYQDTNGNIMIGIIGTATSKLVAYNNSANNSVIEARTGPTNNITLFKGTNSGTGDLITLIGGNVTRFNINTQGVVAISGSMILTGSLNVTGSFITATQSSAPGGAGTEGQIVPVQNGGNYFIYVYIGGAWRSSSLF